MTRAVYIGGFGNGKRLAKGVGEALTDNYYEDVDAFTFSQAMKNPEEIKKAVKGVDVLTHSAGILAVKDAKPKEIRAIGAPVPSTVPSLLLGAGIKTLRMTGHSMTSPEAFKAVNLSYTPSAVGELVSHPVGNLRHIGAIGDTNSIRMAASANSAGIPTWLTYNEKDDFFPLSDDHHTLANTLGVKLEIIPGQHDQLPLYPADTLEKIYK